MTELVALHIETPAVAPLPQQRMSELLVVTSQDDYQHGVELVSEMKGIWKSLDEKRVALKAGALKACRDVDAFFKGPLDYYAAEEVAIKAKLVAFRRAAEAAADKARVEAEKVARAERARLEAEALAAAKSGDVDKAEDLINQSEVVAAPVTIVSAVSAPGSSIRHKWTAHISDKSAFLAEAAKNAALAGLVDVNLNGLSRFAVGAFAPNIPGVVFEREEIIAVRS